MQKIANTSIFYKGKIVQATILQTQNPKILKIINFKSKIQIILGFFNLLKSEERKYNKAFINGSYQEKEIKRKIIKSFNINNQLQNKFNNIFEKLNNIYELNNRELFIDDIFNENGFVNIYGKTIGKGFAGGMKRWNFGGLRKSHGVSVSHRSIGSTGCRKPNRVIKGKKMPGRYGYESSFVSNLKILKIDNKKSILVVKGSVPGHKDNIVKVVLSNKKVKND